MNREDAWALLTEFTTSDSLIKHALAVEAAMRAYARKFGEDEEKWGIVGLIHDFDYERFPTMPPHAAEGARILRHRGWPEEIAHAVASHADYLGIERQNRMEKALRAVDELTGLITAAALVRPTKDIRDISKIKSIKKKFKDKAFAAGVNVLEGEVLGLIAEEYGTTVEDILEANGVDDADLMSIGQELVIVGARRTPIVVVTPSPTPTPTSVYAYQAPHPLGPTDQAVFVGKDVRIVLRWASVRTLDAPEWYEVRIWLQDRPNVDRVWTKTPSVVVPHSLYPGPWGRVFCWDVAVVQRDGQRVNLLSERSQIRRFGWY